MALARIPPVALMRAGDLQDPRAQRTRRALLAAFEHQLESGGEQPSVTSVIQAAAVSRSAFYAHFASLEDLHVAAVRQILDDFGPSPRTSCATGTMLTLAPAATHSVAGQQAEAGIEDTAPVADEAAGHDLFWLPYEALFEHIAAHRHLFSAVFAGIDAPLDQLQHALVEQYRWAIDHAPMRPAEVDSAQAAAFVVGGVLACLTRWLSDPAPCSATRLADQVSALMPVWLVGGRRVQAQMTPAAGRHSEGVE